MGIRWPPARPLCCSCTRGDGERDSMRGRRVISDGQSSRPDSRSITHHQHCKQSNPTINRERVGDDERTDQRGHRGWLTGSGRIIWDFTKCCVLSGTKIQFALLCSMALTPTRSRCCCCVALPARPWLFRRAGAGWAWKRVVAVGCCGWTEC